MNIEQIIALLATKYPGVRKDVLTALASTIALQADTEDEVNSIVGKLTAEKVTKYGQDYRSAIDREIQQSVQTNEEKLRKKYNFVDKEPKQDPPKPAEPQKPTDLTLEAIQQMFQQQMKPLQDELATLKSEKAAAARKEQFAGLFKDKKIPETMMTMLQQQFDHMTFENDEAFQTYLTQTQPTIDQMAQTFADQQLGKDHAPGFGKPDADGVDAAVAAFLKGEQKSDVGGKAI